MKVITPLPALLRGSYPSDGLRKSALLPMLLLLMAFQKELNACKLKCKRLPSLPKNFSDGSHLQFLVNFRTFSSQSPIFRRVNPTVGVVCRARRRRTHGIQ
jgi:hypothetical protein